MLAIGITWSSVQLSVVSRNLECLEATFYSYAAYGSGLNSTLRGGGPTAIGGKKAMLSSPVQNYANEVARDEINHVSITSSSCADVARASYKAGRPVMLRAHHLRETEWVL